MATENDDSVRVSLRIKFDVEEMKNMKKEMLEILARLEESCKECYRRVDESKKLYDTPTGGYFREQATDFVLKNQKYMEDTVIPYVNKLDKIIECYQALKSGITESVGKEEQ